MNRNHMLKRKMTAGLAVGMAVAVGSVPPAMAAKHSKYNRFIKQCIKRGNRLCKCRCIWKSTADHSI